MIISLGISFPNPLPGLHQFLKLHIKITSIVQPDGILTLTVSILGFPEIAGSNRKAILPRVCSCSFLLVVCSNCCSYVRIILKSSNQNGEFNISKISHVFL